MSYGDAFILTLTTMGALIVAACFIHLGSIFVREPEQRVVFYAILGIPALFIAAGALIALIITTVT